MRYNKVIFVCNFAANYGGNFLASLSALASELEARGKDILFVFPETARNKQWEVDLTQFHTTYCDIYSKALSYAVRSFVSPFDRAIIHLHFMSAFRLRMDLKRYMRGRGLFVVHEHMIIPSKLKQHAKGFLLRTFGPRNAVYIGVSPAVYQQLCQEVGKSRSRLVTNAIDTKRLTPSNNHSNNNILIFGIDFERKGVDLAINALLHSQLATKIRLLVVSNDTKDAQNQIIARFGSIPSFVTLMPTSTDAGNLYNNCFLFLSPSRAEAFGYAPVEAAYAGDQVIASDIPGQDTLKDIPGITWIPSDDILQLRQAIEKAYSSHIKNTLNDHTKTQNYIHKHYSLENWVKCILAVYDNQ